MQSQKQQTTAVPNPAVAATTPPTNTNEANIAATTSSGGHRNQLRPVLSFADSFACTYIVSVIGAANAELVTYPLDLTKTRLQIQGEATQAAAQHVGASGRAAPQVGNVTLMDTFST